MINNFRIDGFRSLRKFSMDISPGLNVLVGPNGAGKTNIILFFEFVRLLGSVGVRGAVSEMGGASQVFQKRGKYRFSDSIDCEISGRVRAEDREFIYRAAFSIHSSSSAQEVRFRSQSIFIGDAGSEEIYLDAEWAMADEDRPVLDLRIYNSQAIGGDGGVVWGREEIEKIIQAESFAQQTLINFFRLVSEVSRRVSEDLAGRFLLNVIPSIAKQPEDSTRRPVIDTDGAGLSATLYAIKRGITTPSNALISVGMRPRRQSASSWGKVISLIRVAVSNIEEIDVENDPFDNKLTAKVTIGKGNKKAVLPLSALSDGTVKWMSLVVRLSSSQVPLLLEEPENYLHPLMQREIVRLLRESVDDNGFVLVSTHSETLINALSPDELVVVSYAGGGTRARRIKNKTELCKEIEATGFGLGYYYLADAIRS